MWIGKRVLQILGSLITVPYLERSGSKPHHKFQVIISIDTESGYVEKSGRRVWQIEDRNAFVGYKAGIHNLQAVFKTYNIPATFFVSTQYLSSDTTSKKNIEHQLQDLQKSGHEIGLHIHADSDDALQEKSGKKFQATSAFFYTAEELLEIVSTAKSLLESSVKSKITSFRWGNWALNAGAVAALEKAGIQIDSSATPGLSGHRNDTMRFEWKATNERYPWKLSSKDHQITTDRSGNVAEIPIATFNIGAQTLRADPVYSQLLNAAFKYYYRHADRSHKPFPFVVITHSSEATYKDGSPTPTLQDLESFIKYAKQFDGVEFVTMKKSEV